MKGLLSVFLIFSLITIQAQTCLPEGITFSSQAEIDAFTSNYPSCTEIQGNVFVSGVDNNIINLDGLNGLTSITGILTIYNTGITELNGLNNITGIGQINIELNQDLESISGFSALESISGWYDSPLFSNDGDLDIDNNLALVIMSGFQNLQTVNGRFLLSGNSLLETINGLSNLRTIEGGINIGWGKFSDLSFFSNLLSVGGNLNIHDTELLNLSGMEGVSVLGGLALFNNYSLVNLTGLNSLAVVDWIGINDNVLLESLTGLEGLDSIVDGNINISENTILETLLALTNVTHFNGSNIEIEGNPMLTDCHAQFICDYLTGGNPRTIDDNASGCDTPAEVLEECDGIPSGIFDNISHLINIYPNPSSSILELDLSSLDVVTPVEFSLYDVNGRSLLNQVIESANTAISMEGYPSGIYFLSLRIGDDVYSEKIVVE